MELSQDTVAKLNDCTKITQGSDGQLRFTNTDYKKASFKMYDYNCDIKLRVGSKSFQAHRVVLTNASDYFAAMFGHDMQEKTKDAIEIHEISPVGFSAMMEYFYRGHVTINDNIVADVIEAARFFQVEWLVNACCLFLIRHTSIENFDSVLELAEHFALGDLRYDIYRFIGDNFISLAENQRFHSMSLELFSQLLGDDYYVEAPEGLILHAVIDWLLHDLQERKAHAETLLSFIRFPLLEVEELNSIPDEIKNLPGVKRQVEKAMDYLENSFKQCLILSDEVKLRGSQDVVALMSITDGIDWVQYKDPQLKQGKFINEAFDTMDLECLLEHCAVTTFGNFLFVAGGYNRMYHSINAVYRYDQRSQMWHNAPAMLEPRCNFVFCASDTLLFAVGGVNHDENDVEHVLGTVEVFNPQTNEWTYTTPLQQPTFSHAGTVGGGNLIISGGIAENPNLSIPDDHTYELLKETGVWVVCKKMIVPRQGHAMITHGDNVFVFGGYTVGNDGGYGMVECNENEVYDLKTEQWSLLTPTPDLHGHLLRDVASVGNTIYLVGGSTESRHLSAFDVETKEFVDWESIAPDFTRLASLSIAYPNDILNADADEDELGDSVSGNEPAVV